jgi:uncharacterized membrane protein
MSKSNIVIRAAITSLVTMSAVSFVSTVLAADDEHANEEQCAGIIKAGKNDCATAHNACHSHVEKDKDPMAWIYVPKGTCDKLVGAHVVKVTDPTPKKS